MAALVALFMLAVQFHSDRIAGTDGYFHIAVARLIAEGGPFLRSFPYLRHSVFATNWCDLHFALHLLQAPFAALLPLLTAAKLSAALLGAAALTSFWVAARRLGLLWPELWTLILLGSSFPFLYRFSMPRSQAVGAVLFMLFLALWHERRPRALALVAFVFAWSYQVCLLLVPMGLVLLAAAESRGDRGTRPLMAATAGGLVAGHLINPFVPNNLLYVWWHVVVKTLNPVDLPVGGEWGSYQSWFLVTSSWPSFLVPALVALALAASARGASTRTLGLALVALLFLGLLARHKKFIEYWPLMGLLFAASGVDDLVRPAPGAPPPRIPRPVLVPVVLLLLALAGWQGWRAAEDVGRCHPPDRYRGAARWLANHTPPGSLVLTADWDDPPELLFHNRSNVYGVALDPYFLWLHDRGLYDLWSRTSRGQVVRPSELLTRRFGAEWIFTDATHGAFRKQADSDPHMQKVYDDGVGLVYRMVTGPRTEPPPLQEAEWLLPPRASSGRIAASQNLRELAGVACSNDQQLLYRAGAAGDYVDLAVPVARRGRYRLTVRQTMAADYGVVRLLVGGRPLGEDFDAWSPYVTVRRRVLPGTVEAGDELHVRFLVTGRNPRSGGYFVGVDALELEPVDAPGGADTERRTQR